VVLHVSRACGEADCEPLSAGWKSTVTRPRNIIVCLCVSPLSLSLSVCVCLRVVVLARAVQVEPLGAGWAGDQALRVCVRPCLSLSLALCVWCFGCGCSHGRCGVEPSGAGPDNDQALRCARCVSAGVCVRGCLSLSLSVRGYVRLRH
jgi:hypothetical protein